MAERGYVFRPMNEEEARAVAAWRYEAPYDFCDRANDPEGLAELLGPPERREGYYAVLSDDELVGFFCFGSGGQLSSFDYADDGYFDIGLGLRPDLTGIGLGLEFLLAGLEFGRRHFAPAGFRLAGPVGGAAGLLSALDLPLVATPVAVRYAWADNPVANLRNIERLPVTPFRTDDWEGITAGNHR
jgi:hypothetical protein